MQPSFDLLLTAALRIAVEAHAGTVGRDGRPYILHPLRLMMRAQGDAEQLVAILHDSVEHSDVTLEDLSAAGFPSEIVEAVDSLSRRDGESYTAFIERIALNPLAVRIKMLDLYDNIDLTRLPAVDDTDLKRARKHHRAILRLREVQAGWVRPAES